MRKAAPSLQEIMLCFGWVSAVLSCGIVITCVFLGEEGSTPMTVLASAKGVRSALSAEVFVVPLEANRYLVYAPLRRSAFVTTTGTVNLLADLKEGNACPMDPDSAAAMRLFRELGIVDSGPEVPPGGD